MIAELVEVLTAWRRESPYPADDHFVFASPFTNGKRPYWADSALQDHIQPAAKAAGITKQIGWHTFGHSLATLLGQRKEDVKTVQELRSRNFYDTRPVASHSRCTSRVIPTRSALRSHPCQGSWWSYKPRPDEHCVSSNGKRLPTLGAFPCCCRTSPLSRSFGEADASLGIRASIVFRSIDPSIRRDGSGETASPWRVFRR
jgi:hypothetical protein